MAVSYQCGFENMDMARVTAMLSTARWNVGVPLATLTKTVENSGFCAGAFDENGRQIAFARAVTDKTRFAYIADVFVDEAYRGQGIGTGLIRFIRNHPEMQGVYQWLLVTKNDVARHVYENCGFAPMEHPERWLQIWGSWPGNTP